MLQTVLDFINKFIGKADSIGNVINTVQSHGRNTTNAINDFQDACNDAKELKDALKKDGSND